ncbi:MAG: polysaccharide deacetylase family protein [Pirellulaceae bacterium]
MSNRIEPIYRLVAAILLAASIGREAQSLEPVPEKLVVLTFDDSVKSHFTHARPILKRYGFGATFFITEGFDFPTNKKDYMTWDEIAQLHKDGFEIGNHTRDHLGITSDKVDQFDEQLAGIEARCKEHGIPKPVSFAWPGNATAIEGFEVLRRHGVRFARRGGAPEYPYEKGEGFAYEPHLDHPLLIPSAGDARPDWELEDFVRAVEQARPGRVAVLQFHGVPDGAHAWVNTPADRFEMYMKYLADNGYRVIALRDLEKYVDPAIAPRRHDEVIKDRQHALAAKRSRGNARRPQDDDELRDWLANMTEHRFAASEMAAALGMTTPQVEAALARLAIAPRPPERDDDAPLRVLPYPGGRHPRRGFLDGAIRPQRETKVSVFTPWQDGGYVVADVPEAIWWKEADERELLYLAHTHVPTHWSKQEIDLPPREWRRDDDGRLSCERRLPNGVVFGTRVVPRSDMVQMEMWITNGTPEMLTGLRVQNCVMLARAAGFAGPPDESHLHFQPPYAARRSADAARWIISAWEPNQRTWANPDCPCLHSDPQFSNCAPGETERLRGGLWFYQGDDIRQALKKIEQSNWRDASVRSGDS